MTLCTTRVCSQSGEESSSRESGESGGSGESVANKIEGRMVKILSMLVNDITVMEKRLRAGNGKMGQMWVTIASAVSKGPSGIFSRVALVDTTVIGKEMEVLAFVLKKAGMDKQSMMVENFGSSLKFCYNDKKQDVFKTALVSIPMCIGEDTKSLVEMATADMNAFQVILLDMEKFVQDLQGCETMGCYRSQAKMLGKQYRNDLMNWGKTRGKILMKGATLLPETAECLGKHTGMTTIQEAGTVLKGFGSCVVTESKK